MKSGSGKKSSESIRQQDWRTAIRRTSALVCGTLFISAAQTAIAAPEDRPSMREFREIHTDLTRREARELFKNTYNARSATGASLPPRMELKQQRLEAAIIRHAELQNNDVIKRGLQAKLDRIGVQQIGTNLVRLNSGVDLDLTSADRNIVLGTNLFSSINSSVEITVGGQTETYSAGSKVTAAEYIAIKQALFGNGQKLVIDGSGIARGGSLDLTAITGNNDPMRAANLTVASGVTTYGDFGKNSNFILKGDLNNYGSIYAVSSTNSARGGAIRADDITNQSGALISSVLPSNLLGGSYASKVDLELNARGQLTNLGTIESSGNLTLVSQLVPTVSNTSPQVGSTLTNSGTISAQDSVFITANNVNNSRTITAVNGAVSINGSPTLAINVNNTNGTISALNGAINVRNADYKGTFNNNITGGDLLSKEVNLFAGNATNEVVVNQLTGLLSQTGSAGHVSTATDNLQIGDTCFTGDPTFYNNGSQISISGTVTFAEDIVFISTGNIIGINGFSVEARNGTQGYDVTMIAGANITTPGTGTNLPGSTGASVTLDGASTNGGSITLGTGSVLTNPTGTQGNGGNVNLYAFKGTSPTSGRIDANDATIVTSGAGTGTNGNITMIGGGVDSVALGTAIQIGAMNTSGGTGGGGNLFVSTSQPTITGGPSVTYNADGTRAAGGLLIGSAVTSNASIGFAGGVTRVGGDVTLAAGQSIVQAYDGFEPTSTLFMTKVDATIDLTAAAGNIGDVGQEFVIQGFNKPFTKSIAKKNPNGTTDLILNAGASVNLVRQMSTDLKLNTSTVVSTLNLYTNSKLTVEGTITSTNGAVRLQNQGGNFLLDDNADIIANTAIEVTNGSKNNLKPTLILDLNSGMRTTAAGTPGPGGVGIISINLDQKAFKGVPRPGLQGRRGVVPTPTLQGGYRIFDWVPLYTVRVENGNGEILTYGKPPSDAQPTNTFTANNANIEITNGGKKGSVLFNGGVELTAGN